MLSWPATPIRSQPLKSLEQDAKVSIINHIKYIANLFAIGF